MSDLTRPIAPIPEQVTRCAEMLADVDGQNLADVDDVDLFGYVVEADPIVEAINAYLDVA